jgi:hypothetical protein
MRPEFIVLRLIKLEARQMRVCRASTGGHTGGQGPTRASQVYLILIACPM